jgi:methylmalonyl-CoA/ethylmalonyl-CoA epimerase
VTPLRRLDHVAIAVEDTERALEYFAGALGLAVVSSEEIAVPRARLTYLDAGNTYVQLVQPLDADSELALWLGENGEGIHHICFGVDDVPEAVEKLSGAQPSALGSGRGRISGFLPPPHAHGVRVECTEFDLASDVERTPGWLNGSG